MSYLDSLGNIGLNPRVSPYEKPVSMEVGRVGQPITLYKIICPGKKFPKWVVYMEKDSRVKRWPLNRFRKMHISSAAMNARNLLTRKPSYDMVEMPQYDWENYRRQGCDIQRFESFSTRDMVRLEGNAMVRGLVEPGDMVISNKMLDDNGMYLLGTVKWVKRGTGIAQVHWHKYGRITNVPASQLRTVTNAEYYRYTISRAAPSKASLGKYSPPWDFIERNYPGMKHLEKPDWILLKNFGMKRSGKVPYNHNDEVAMQMKKRGYNRLPGDMFFEEHLDEPITTPGPAIAHRGMPAAVDVSPDTYVEETPPPTPSVGPDIPPPLPIVPRAPVTYTKPAVSITGHKKSWASDSTGRFLK